MKILYVASGIPVPGSLGGSTHTLEVARGLAERGHHVDVVACRTEGRFNPFCLIHPLARRYHGFQLHWIDLPKSASLLAYPTIMRLAMRLQPDIVMERYYNFAGSGLLAAQQLNLPTLLEVNALIIDPPEVRKRQLDDRLGGPMRRWAERQCRMASAIVTPLHTTIPATIDRAKIHELPWGAAVERFTPQNRSPRVPGQPATLVFLGSFRAWHGVTDFVHAAGMLLEKGQQARFVLVGDGPQRQEAERLAAQWPGAFTFMGAVAYERIPEILATADIGVAPFSTAPHPALRAAGFFWSPLKIYEYMAAGLPVITANIAPLNTIIRDQQEGLLVREGDPADLARAMAILIENPNQAHAMGLSGRERVVAHYSWAQHCADLERILQTLGGAGHGNT